MQKYSYIFLTIYMRTYTYIPTNYEKGLLFHEEFYLPTFYVYYVYQENLTNNQNGI